MLRAYDGLSSDYSGYGVVQVPCVPSLEFQLPAACLPPTVSRKNDPVKVTVVFAPPTVPETGVPVPPIALNFPESETDPVP